ncbi:hypothetical protein [Streptomyces sp. NPDC055886]
MVRRLLRPAEDPGRQLLRRPGGPPLPEGAVEPSAGSFDLELPWADERFLEDHYGEGNARRRRPLQGGTSRSAVDDPDAAGPAPDTPFHALARMRGVSSP